MLLTKLNPGILSYVGSNQNGLQFGDHFQKGPPGLKTADWAYLNASDRSIMIDGISYHNINKERIQSNLNL